ncbi:MAG: nuclear transport factor 2 family protein [Flavobacteriaceae bacterium]|nr:nuclear transport factor 2 family protein [Flavobacteriaceae bacterium]
MKNGLLFLTFIFFLLTAQAQQPERIEVKQSSSKKHTANANVQKTDPYPVRIEVQQSVQDDKEIKAVESTIVNYIENFFENNFDEMNKSLHPRLAKRGLNPDGMTMSDDFPPEKLKELMKTKPKFDKKHQYNVVKDVAIYGNMASASLKTGYPKTRWTEYIHLVKQNGDWKIINVFWEFEKKKR